MGALLALASAAAFGLNNATLRRGVLTGSVLHALAITVPVGVPLFAIVCAGFGGFDALYGFTLPAWAWLALAGIVHFVVGRYGNYRATHALGAALSAPVQQFSVPIAVVLALLLLDEFLTPLRLLGFGLVMAGPLLAIGNREQRETQRRQPGFSPRYAEGILWSTVCAVGYGVSPLLIVIGLGPARTLSDSLAGGFVSYLAATLVVAIPIAAAGGTVFLRTLDRGAGKWFLLSGLFVFVSQMLRYMALAIAPVSVVVPIQRLSVVFRVVFTWLLNRDHEVLGPRVLAGIGLSLAGAIALTVSTEQVAAVMPAAFGWLLGWRWP